jgi:TRAP-type C4-dicarboxylate transport system substrate-binding protein
MLRKIAVEKADAATRENLEGEAALTAQFEKAGLIVTAPKPADVDAAAAKMKPFWAKWAASKKPSTQQALKAALAAIGQ